MTEVDGLGLLLRIRHGPAFEAADKKTIISDATHLKTRRTASGLRVKTGRAGG